MADSKGYQGPYAASELAQSIMKPVREAKEASDQKLALIRAQRLQARAWDDPETMLDKNTWKGVQQFFARAYYGVPSNGYMQDDDYDSQLEQAERFNKLPVKERDAQFQSAQSQIQARAERELQRQQWIKEMEAAKRTGRDTSGYINQLQNNPPIEQVTFSPWLMAKP